MTKRKKNVENIIWYPCLDLITVMYLFLQGTPTSPIPLRQRGAAQINFLKGTTTRKDARQGTSRERPKAMTRNKYVHVSSRGASEWKLDPLSKYDCVPLIVFVKSLLNAAITVNCALYCM